MPQNISVTYNDQKITVDWLSDAAGAVALGIAAALDTRTPLTRSSKAEFCGRITAIETIPGLSGDRTTTTPTTLYDVTLLDQYGCDVAGGQLLNRSASSAEKIVPYLPIAIDGELTLAIANAGDSKTGRVIIWFD